MKNRLSALCLLIAFALVPSAGQAADRPDKPVTIVVSHAAGNKHDANSSGAAGAIGTAEAAAPKPYGHILHIFNSVLEKIRTSAQPRQ